MQENIFSAGKIRVEPAPELKQSSNSFRLNLDLPVVGCNTPAISCSSVLFPLPFTPIIPTLLPLLIERLTSDRPNTSLPRLAFLLLREVPNPFQEKGRRFGSKFRKGNDHGVDAKAGTT